MLYLKTALFCVFCFCLIIIKKRNFQLDFAAIMKDFIADENTRSVIPYFVPLLKEFPQDLNFSHMFGAATATDNEDMTKKEWDH